MNLIIQVQEQVLQGDMSIDYLRVETCGTFCIAPSSIGASAITQTSATISWAANSGESAWEYVVQTCRNWEHQQEQELC